MANVTVTQPPANLTFQGIVVPGSTLNPKAFFSGSNSNEGVEAICDLLFPDGMPMETLSIIQASTATISDPTLRTKNAVRLAMASPFYNMN